MSVKKNKLSWGIVLMGSFAAILVFMFIPVFGDKNSLSYMDDLYNAMSKGSAYYIPGIQKEVAEFKAPQISQEIDLGKAEFADVAKALLTSAGASVTVSDTKVSLSGDLTTLLNACLADADLMYHNDGAAVKAKYGSDERVALYTWFLILKATEKGLTRDKLFKEAMMVATVNHKTVEGAYNFYRIEPRTIGGSVGILIFSLLFYVIYTMWYGFGVMFLFEGLGLNLDH